MEYTKGIFKAWVDHKDAWHIGIDIGYCNYFKENHIVFSLFKYEVGVSIKIANENR